MSMNGLDEVEIKSDKKCVTNWAKTTYNQAWEQWPNTTYTTYLL